MAHTRLPSADQMRERGLPKFQHASGYALNFRSLSLALSLVIAGLVVLPVGFLLTELLDPGLELWRHLWATTLPLMIANTVKLVIGVGLGTFLTGTLSAWLVTIYEFPGRALFEHALILPLAIPAFIMGFIFMATFDYAGSVQTQWREWFGAGAFFPDIYSTGGVTIVMTLVLYPYVYVLARAAFREQTAVMFEAAQVMGYSRTQTFFRLVLPLARPSIAAGVVLAMMEALTDYGTVRFFGYSTLSEGIVRIWEGRMDRDSAVELASMLVVFAFGIILLERLLRGRARYYQQGGKGRRPRRVKLSGFKKWFAITVCTGLVSLAFILPVMQTIIWAYKEVSAPTVGAWQDVYLEYISNTTRLAAMTAGVVVVLSLIVAHGVRRTSLSGERRFPRLVTKLVTLGYAMPGAVIAVGVLALVAPIDHQVSDFLAEHFGRTARSLIFTGTSTGLIYAYVVRFMAVGFNTVESSLDKVTPNMEEAAQTMGAGTVRVLGRVHLPLISSGLAAGAILVFVDVMKELPTTLLLRPFGMDTLALWAYFLAAESFWQAAAIPSLTILVVGLIPVFFLMRIDRTHD